MRLFSWLPAWLEQRIPPDVEEAERPRHFVFVVTAALGVVLSLGAVALGLVNHLPTMTTLNALDLAFCLTVLWAYPRTTERSRRWLIRSFLAWFALMLGAGVNCVEPMDPTPLMFHFVLLLLATLMLGRELLAWVAIIVLVDGVALLIGGLGLNVQEHDPAAAATHLLNVIGALACTVAMIQALSRDNARAIERIRQAERAKSAFFANVGHEIRTPMNGVLGMADALLARPLPAADHEMVEVIHSSGRVLLALIDDVLDLSRLEAHQLVLRPDALSLEGLTHELRNLWMPAATQRGLAWSVSLAPDLPSAVLVDGVRLRQVLNNLLNNALKFTEAGEVAVRLFADAGQLCADVEDTGIGIAVDQQARLFQRFVQADDVRARRGQGSGLGLALSRQLVEHMGGTLRLQSMPGVGSVFHVRLPLVAAALPALEDRARSLPPGLKVLVVDDNPVNRLVAQRLLGSSGCEVSVVEGGQAAVQALTERAFDVVLMDVHMPDVDGLEATRRIRAGGNTQPRIIGVSASAAQADVESCHAAGMNDFLAKPVTRERLVAALLRHL